MRKTIVVTCIVIFLGILSYLGGYFYYSSIKSEISNREPVLSHRTVQFLESDPLKAKESYLAIIEEDMLVIYKIPENIIYDSVKLSTLQLTDSEYAALINGITIDNLVEVFEFLENSMS